MSIVDVNSGDSGGGVPATRTINTTLPLTGGGPLSADLTLGVNDATTTTVGVVKLAANLAGTGLLPYVTGFTADTITIQNLTGLTHKGVWTTVGLRIGDNTAPTEVLDVNGRVKGGANTGKVILGNYNAAPATYGGIWLGTSDPTIDAQISFYGTSNVTVINGPGGGGAIQVLSNNATALANWTTTGLRLGDLSAPSEKLDVLGRAKIGIGAAKVVCDSYPGSTATISSIWLGAAVPTAFNYALIGDNTSTIFNANTNVAVTISGSYIANFISTGLRLGDGTNPTAMLDVLGNAIATGSITANVTGTVPATLRVWTGGGGYSALYLTGAAHSNTNFAILSEGTNTFINAPTGDLFFQRANTSVGNWSNTGLRIGDGTTATAKLDVVGDSLLGKTDESSLSTLRGGELGTVHEVSTAYTVDSGTLTDRLLVVLASGGDVTITLPPTSASLPPAGTKGRKIIVKRKYGSDSTVFITPDGANTIEGGTDAISLSSADDGIEPFCEVEDDGTTWQVTRIHGGQIAPP